MFRPRKQEVDQLKPRNFLGEAKVTSLCTAALIAACKLTIHYIYNKCDKCSLKLNSSSFRSSLL